MTKQATARIDGCYFFREGDTCWWRAVELREGMMGARWINPAQQFAFPPSEQDEQGSWVGPLSPENVLYREAERDGMGRLLRENVTAEMILAEDGGQ